MTRLHVDPVEVRTHVVESGPEPEQFLWRGRLYVVREVLARWTAAGAWWKGSPHEVDDKEQHWWRVEAGSLRSTGTYDLCFSWAQGWTLRRVQD
jgi:hypothetical protein